MEAVFAILISVGLGYWADSYFETGPIGLIAGAVIGFAAFVLRLFRMNELVLQAQEQMDQATAEAAETSPQRSVASRSAGTNGILGAEDRRPFGDLSRSDEVGEKDTEDR